MYLIIDNDLLVLNKAKFYIFAKKQLYGKLDLTNINNKAMFDFSN